MFSLANGADEALYLRGESHVAGQGSFGFLVSSYTGPWLFSSFDIETLHVLERVGWWGTYISCIWLFKLFNNI